MTRSAEESRQVLFGKLDNPQVILAGFHDPLRATGGIGTVMRSIERHLPRFHLVFWNPERSRELDTEGRWIWPVQLSDDVIRAFQREFLKQYIWPCLHGLSSNIAYESLESLRIAVRQASGAFIEAIADLVQSLPSDRPILVWVNDYGLAWCLAGLRASLPSSVRVGISFRCPFGLNEMPQLHTQDVKDLVSHLCSCDFVSFHRTRDVAHFLSAVQACAGPASRAIVSEEDGTIQRGSHVTHTRAVPMGNDPIEIQEIAVSERTVSLMHEFKKMADHRRILASVSRLEPHKGILHELQMISEFLSDRSPPSKTLSFIRLMPVPAEYRRLSVYDDLFREVNRRAERINEEYGSESWKPVHLLSDRVYDRHEVVALLRATDVLAVLSEADGFSHMPLELLMCKQQTDPSPVLLLSDIGVSDYIPGSYFKIKPDIDALGKRLQEALLTDYDTRQSMFERGRVQSETMTAHRWAVSVLTGIIRPDLLNDMALEANSEIRRHTIS